MYVCTITLCNNMMIFYCVPMYGWLYSTLLFFNLRASRAELWLVRAWNSLSAACNSECNEPTHAGRKAPPGLYTAGCLAYCMQQRI